jgi:hypothetical protein
MDAAKTSLFPLPPSQVIETLYVQFPDGTILPRTPAEVQVLQNSGQSLTVVGRATQ